MTDRQYYVYVVTNKKRGVFYTGVTSNLVKRISEHKNGLIEGFTKRYNLNKLVYYEIFHDINYAISREKRLKRWLRSWKIEMIEKENPHWDDLFAKIF